MEYAHKLNELEVGRMYLVAHARVEYFDTKEVLFVPIIPNLHSDPQFGEPGALQHYHVDGRFDMSRKARQQWNIKPDGKSNHVVYQHSHDISYKAYHTTSIVFKKKKCRSNSTGTMPPMRSKWGYKSVYLEWYKEYIGKSCKGKKCPHFGTNMIDNGDGTMYCPLHDLHASTKTEKVIKHPRRNQVTH